jgi:hypothetical protein
LPWHLKGCFRNRDRWRGVQSLKLLNDLDAEAQIDSTEVFPGWSFMSPRNNKCSDPVVGAILASWRYDISSISPEMRKDYEQHFAECKRCSARQRFHRSLDATLAVLFSLSALFFLFALAVMKHVRPLEHVASKVLGLDIFDMYHMLVSAGIAGLCFSLIAIALVLLATPAPSYLGGIAAERARLIEQRFQSLRPR